MPRDGFYWLGQINKASIIINTEEGLLDSSYTSTFAKGLRNVLAAGEKEGAERPARVITFEPYLIKEVGPEITRIHVGRSSQDMLMTVHMAIIREDLLSLAQNLETVKNTIALMAEKYRHVVMPSYTNGVAAQPTTFAHYLLAFHEGFNRDTQRLHNYYERIDRSPMGSTVLNGTSWPLNRERMANYLGFPRLAYNAYDATQIYNQEYALDAASIVTHLAIRINSFIEDVFQQYAQPRPWMVLQEGGANTYVSSAMPQKRNPGILMNTRHLASSILGEASGCIYRSTNLPPGMTDSRGLEMNEMLHHTTQLLQDFNHILTSLVINPERAKEELNLDWTASQEVADILMRKYNVPFRIGHHVASQIVSFARANDIKPLDFPHQEAARIYKEILAETPIKEAPADFPLDEKEFAETLNPEAIINNRATKGGPQPSEITFMLSEATHDNEISKKWILEKTNYIEKALTKLEEDFSKL